ncbi:MAG: hypothetical protein EP329_11090 [Deltaproteobacteria bacterium]|nr:MAG: hypothetical protein EP329_11090 [Deltaproteobacteria bacterium]
MTDPIDIAPVDLTPLDPSRDEPRWERMIASVVQRALTEARRLTVARQLAAWARPVLAIAATLAIAAWTGAALTPTGATATAPTSVMTQWAYEGQAPEAATIFETLGGDHGE